MKTVYQLAKLSRRIPRVISRYTYKLMKPGLTEKQVKEYQLRVFMAGQANQLLKREMVKRRIGLPAIRNTVSPAVAKRAALRDLALAA
jgi:hypothetical protein